MSQPVVGIATNPLVATEGGSVNMEPEAVIEHCSDSIIDFCNVKCLNVDDDLPSAKRWFNDCVEKKCIRIVNPIKTSKTECMCGRTFSNERGLNAHLGYHKNNGNLGHTPKITTDYTVNKLLFTTEIFNMLNENLKEINKKEIQRLEARVERRQIARDRQKFAKEALYEVIPRYQDSKILLPKCVEGCGLCMCNVDELEEGNEMKTLSCCGKDICVECYRKTLEDYNMRQRCPYCRYTKEEKYDAPVIARLKDKFTGIFNWVNHIHHPMLDGLM